MAALAQAAEPVTEAQAEALGPALVAGAEKSAMTADPSDYTVANDGTIEVQATETLGHYAEWLDVRATHLRELNRLRFGTPVVIGQRLKIDTGACERGRIHAAPARLPRAAAGGLLHVQPHRGHREARRAPG
jgi:membrane-bound lytic murein transglycosylase D